MSVIVVQGFSPTNKVPGFKAATISPSGRSSSALFRHIALLVGQMGASATASTNTLYPVYGPADADQFGPRSELGRMCRAALLVDGATLMAISPAAAGGAAAATATITIGGTWTAAWSITYRVGGVLVPVTIGSGDSPTNAATKIAAAFGSVANVPCTATSSSAVVTLTIDSAGARGNQYLLAQDTSQMPSTATSGLAGGTPVTGGIVPFTGGSGVETFTSLLAVVATSQFDAIGLSCNDATSLQAWQTHLRSQAGATIGNLEAACFFTSGALSAAQSLSQTSLNEIRMHNGWLLNSETHPSELAAELAARISVTEEANPSPRYMNVPLACAYPQTQRADWPIESVRDAALNAGVSPCMTTPDNKVVVNRLITTYCKLGSAQDDRVLDANQRSMPDYARARLRQIWEQEVAPANDHVKDNPGPTDPDPPAGTITPDIWDATIHGEEKTWEANGWVINVDANPPVSVYDQTGRRLMTECTVVPSPLNYQAGVNIRQANS